MTSITFNFIGTGNAFSKNFGNNSALVTVENNGVRKNILIDCGRTVPDGLKEQGIKWEEIDGIFVSHLHGDHVYGLEEAGFYGRYVLNRKPHLIFPSKKIKNDLWDKVLKGTMMNGDLQRNMVLEDYFTYDIVDEKAQFFDFNDVMISVYPTEHIPNKKSYGLIFGTSNYVIFTCDTLFQHDLVDMALADGCQAIFHDCGIVDYEGKVHASLKDLMEIGEEDRDKIYVMHYPDNLDEHYLDIKDRGFNIALKNHGYEFVLDKY